MLKISGLAPLSLCALVFSCCLSAQQTSREDREPEAATGYDQKKAQVGEKFMVSAANPYAAWAGKNIIKRGGSAIDAAVAVQAMLTLVEPQSSGLGGGTFILYWDNENKQLHTFDGRETAPSAANSYLFMNGTKPLAWGDAVVGGKSVGAPGVLRALEMAHQDFGKLPWASLFSDPEKIASKGFPVSERLARLVALDFHPGLKAFPATKGYFYPDGEPIKQGYLRKNHRLASVFARVAEQGADAFYEGDIAQKIVDKVQNASINPGLLSVKDVKNYQAVKRAPVCSPYRHYRVCGMAPPSSGGINVAQILGMLEGFDMAQFEPNAPQAIHLFTQASRLAYADRNLYIADSDFTELPFAALINKTYLARRAQSIVAGKDMQRARAGKPYTQAYVGRDNALELPNTSHIAIVDEQGNAVSMTSSIEFGFGSGLMVEGFLLNNQLTDFSLQPMQGTFPVLNRVEPNKRPRSAMSPTMVFNEKNELVLVVGSPGGSRIINYVAQAIIAVLDWDMNIQQAINLPKVTNRNDYTALEKGTAAERLKDPLQSWGHNVKVIDLNSGLHGVQIKGKTLIGGADPRREGVAVGE